MGSVKDDWEQERQYICGLVAAALDGGDTSDIPTLSLFRLYRSVLQQIKKTVEKQEGK